VGEVRGGGRHHADLLPVLLQAVPRRRADGLAHLVEADLLLLAHAHQHHPARVLDAVGMVQGHDLEEVRLEVAFVHGLARHLADREGKPVPLPAREHGHDERVAAEVLARR
jgi:hypothetical protein